MKIFEHFFHKKKIQQRNFIIFSIILNGWGLLILFYYLVFQANTYYLMTYLLAGVAGLIIETIGTKLYLWEYYTKEKPPAISFFGWGSAVTIIIWIVNIVKLI